MPMCESLAAQKKLVLASEMSECGEAGTSEVVMDGETSFIVCDECYARYHTYGTFCSEQAYESLTFHQYVFFMDKLDDLKGKAEAIGKLVAGHHVNFKRFEKDVVVCEFNSACHCHPQREEIEYPSKYLFEENIEERLAEDRRKKKEAEAIENAKVRARAIEEPRVRDEAKLQELAQKLGKTVS